MPYSVTYIKEKNYILVEIREELTLEVLGMVAEEVSKIGSHTGCQCILNDLRGAKLTIKAYQVLHMPKKAQNAGVPLTIKRALIVSDRLSEFKFLETVFVNQGHWVKMFSTLEDGENWLFNDRDDF